MSTNSCIAEVHKNCYINKLCGKYRSLCKHGRVLASALAALYVGSLPTSVYAQYRQEATGARVGTGRVIRIFENNRFDRCSAEFFDTNGNMLRIAFNKKREYSLSIPQVAVQGSELLTITVSSTGSGKYAAYAGGNSNGRAYRPLDLMTVQKMMDFRGPLIIQAASTRYQWNLGTSLDNVFGSIENCRNVSSGWR